MVLNLKVKVGAPAAVAAIMNISANTASSTDLQILIILSLRSDCIDTLRSILLGLKSGSDCTPAAPVANTGK
jgi:hypothetical protein